MLYFYQLILCKYCENKIIYISRLSLCTYYNKLSSPPFLLQSYLQKCKVNLQFTSRSANLYYCRIPLHTYNYLPTCNWNFTNMTTIFSSFKLSWYDYVAFAAMLLVSASIGVYFGFFKSRYNTIREYLLGGRKMKIVPIALSIAVR
jgi:hypothetical protein